MIEKSLNTHPFLLNLFSAQTLQKVFNIIVYFSYFTNTLQYITKGSFMLFKGVLIQNMFLFCIFHVLLSISLHQIFYKKETIIIYLKLNGASHVSFGQCYKPVHSKN